MVNFCYYKKNYKNQTIKKEKKNSFYSLNLKH